MSEDEREREREKMSELEAEKQTNLHGFAALGFEPLCQPFSVLSIFKIRSPKLCAWDWLERPDIHLLSS
jgi:hypothetical protein